MGLNLFVYGELNSLNFEIANVDDDEDAKGFLIESIDTISRTFSRNCSNVIGTHMPITKEEFDNWVDTGYWSDKTSGAIKTRIRETRINILNCVDSLSEND